MATRRAHIRTTAGGKRVRVGEAVIASGRGGWSRTRPSDPDQMARLRTAAAAQAAAAGAEPGDADFYLDAGEGGGPAPGPRASAAGEDVPPDVKKKAKIGGYGMNRSGMSYAMTSLMRRNGGGGGQGAGGGPGKFKLDPNASMAGRLIAWISGGGGAPGGGQAG